MMGYEGEYLLNVTVQRELAESKWKAVKSTIDGVCATMGNDVSTVGVPQSEGQGSMRCSRGRS